MSLIEITPLGAPGTLYTADIPDEVEHVEAVLRVPHPVGVPSTERDISGAEVPGAWVAVLVHPGGDGRYLPHAGRVGRPQRGAQRRADSRVVRREPARHRYAVEVADRDHIADETASPV